MTDRELIQQLRSADHMHAATKLLCDEAADRLEALASRPDGWVMVPREPTEAMVVAGWATANDPGPNPLGVITDTECCRIWTAMLSALPPAPQPDE